VTEKPLADLIRGVVWVGDRSDPSVLVTMRADIHEALAEVAVAAEALRNAAIAENDDCNCGPDGQCNVHGVVTDAEDALDSALSALRAAAGRAG